MNWFWIIYLSGVLVMFLFWVYITRKELKDVPFKESWKDYMGLFLLGVFWPCFILQIIAKTLDILIG